MHLWPERVVEACREDRSLAIAHGLKEVFWEQDEEENWRAREVAEEEVARLVQERTNPEVKAALRGLQEVAAQ